MESLLIKWRDFRTLGPALSWLFANLCLTSAHFYSVRILWRAFFFKIYLYVMCNITHVFSFMGFVSLLIDLQMSCPRSNSLYVNFHKIDKSWVHHADCHSQGLCSPFPFIVVPLTSHFKIVGSCGICEKNDIFNNKWWYESVRTT